MKELILDVKDLAVEYTRGDLKVRAVAGVDLQLGAGEILGLVGESGCGKSTLGKAAVGILDRAEGDVTFDGKSVAKIGRGKRDPHFLSLQMIFQDPYGSLNPRRKIGEQIADGPVIQGMSRSDAIEKAKSLLERVGLPANAVDRFPHQFSGGQRQRIAIARALAINPRVIVADEPISALDTSSQAAVANLLVNLVEEFQMGMIFISHDLSIVRRISDRVAVMYLGKIVETGRTEEIWNSPSHPYTKALLACRPAAHKKGTRLPLVSDFLYPEATTPSPADFIAKKTSERSPFIEVESLCVGYPMKKNWLSSKTNFQNILHDVSFSIQKGEMLGLVGESGSGKSTLGRTLLGLIRPTAGSIHHEGKDLLKIQPNHWPLKRHQLQLVFQDPYSSLNPRMTIGDAISEPLLVHGKVRNKKLAREQTMQWLDRVQLKTEHYHRYPHEFSGGQRQRIVIARALALEPAFVVCDESVSALDVSIQAQVLNLLNDLRRELGFTCLFISHDLGVVRYLCDRLIVLEQGRVVEWGDAETVCSTPQNPYTKRLLDSIPKLQSVE